MAESFKQPSNMPVCLYVTSRFASHMCFDESHECKQVVINPDPKASFTIAIAYTKHLEQSPNPKHILLHTICIKIWYICVCQYNDNYFYYLN